MKAVKLLLVAWVLFLTSCAIPVIKMNGPLAELEPVEDPINYNNKYWPIDSGNNWNMKYLKETSGGYSNAGYYKINVTGYKAKELVYGKKRIKSGIFEVDFIINDYSGKVSKSNTKAYALKTKQGLLVYKKKVGRFSPLFFIPDNEEYDYLSEEITDLKVVRDVPINTTIGKHKALKLYGRKNGVAVEYYFVKDIGLTVSNFGISIFELDFYEVM